MTGLPVVGRDAGLPARRTRRASRPAGPRRRPAAGSPGQATRLRGRTAGGRCWDDRGNAVIEFVFLGVLLLAPLMYLVLAVSAVQRNLYGVTQAAREAGRAYATGTAANAADRAGYAARLALEDQGLSADDAVIRYGAPGGDCASASAEPPAFAPGGEFAVCVSRPFTVPGVPGFLVGARSSVTGRYVVHLDQYRDYGDGDGAP
ncbi:MAG: hypothetical protein V7637_5814 [Mycobacteriales bacterium]